jgi:hypothetical protein
MALPLSIPQSSIISTAAKYPVGLPNTGLSTLRAAQRPMRNVTKKAAGKVLGKGLGKAAVVAKTAFDVGRLALSEDARQEEADKVLEMAENSSAVDRFTTGLLDPVNTGYGIARLIGDTVTATREANKSAAAAPSDEEIANRYEQAKLAKRQKEAERQALEAEKEKQSFTEAADKRIASAVQPIEEALTPVQIPNEKEFDSDGSLQMEDPAMSNKGSEQADQAPDPDLVEQLFITTHGTSFDPKSKRDIQKRSEIEEMLGGMGGELGKTTPNQFALQLYRKYKYL